MAPSAATSKSGERSPVLIIGAHRSGTTATARALELMRLQIGQDLDSHRESKKLQKLHEEYLRGVGASWHNPAPFLESIHKAGGRRACVEFLRRHIEKDFPALFGYRKNPRGLWMLAGLKRGVAWGWKEPRATLFGPAWLEIYPEARVIHVVRHPMAVAMSIRQRELRFREDGDAPNSGLDDIEHCLRLALAYVEAGEELAKVAAHYRLVRFEDIQANSRETLQQLAEFSGLGLTRPRLLKAAVSIKLPGRPAWRALPEKLVRDLYRRYPRIAKLGYGLDNL